LDFSVEALQLSRQPLFFGTFSRLCDFSTSGVRLKLVEQRGGVVEQLRNVVPNRGVQFRDLGLVLWANTFVVGILAMTLVITEHAAAAVARVREAEHGPTAGATRQQTAEQVRIPTVVPKRHRGVAGQLRRGLLMRRLIDNGRHVNGNPFVLRTWLTADVLGSAPGGCPPSARRDISIAIGVGDAFVERVRENVMYDGLRPQPFAATRPPRSAGQTFDDLPDRHLLVDQPAVQHADHFRFRFIDDNMPRHAVPFADITVAIGNFARQPLSGPIFL
jgi:hypothetical protein